MKPKRSAKAPREIAAGVYWLQVRGANVYFARSASSWALIDAGWQDSGPAVAEAAEALFGRNLPPAAILLTHAHPDHEGAAAELARRWQAPVYVHAADLPLLTGDVFANAHLMDPIGRFVVLLMRLLPRRARERMQSADLKDAARALPEKDAGVPGLEDWEYVFTPGHSPGHVVFFRKRDRVLIAGDAVLTTPLWGLLPSLRRVSRPPRLSCWNWRGTMTSIAALAFLEPVVLACGHGIPMAGAEVAGELRALSVRVSGSVTWQPTKGK